MVDLIYDDLPDDIKQRPLHSYDYSRKMYLIYNTEGWISEENARSHIKKYINELESYCLEYLDINNSYYLNLTFLFL